MDNNQLEQYIDAVRADLSYEIGITELRQQLSNVIQRRNRL